MTEEEHKIARNLLYEAISSSEDCTGTCLRCNTTKDLKGPKTQGFFITRCRICYIKDLIKYYWFYTTGISRSYKRLNNDLQRRST